MINTHCTQSPSTSFGPRPSTRKTRRVGRLGAAALGCAALVGFAGFGPATTASAVNDTVTLSYTGASQTVTVPDGVTGAFVLVDGGGGADGYDPWGNLRPGGAGAEVTATLLLSPGSTLTVDVGGKPKNAQETNSAENPTPGWGGDAPGGTSYGNDDMYLVGGAGGGASSIRVDGTYEVMAGGGGGGGGSGFGAALDKGGKGGSAAANGHNGSDGANAGHGNGGAWGAQSGMAGGPGGPQHHDAGPGGGGGGGWAGGNGGTGGSTGGGGGGGGGAGSSYVGAQTVNTNIVTDPSSSDGQVQITWIRSAICTLGFEAAVSAFDATQFTLPCYFQGVPGTSITFDSAAQGTLSVVDAATGVVEYTPSNPGYVGTDQFSFTLTNANNEPITATMTLNLQPGDAVQTSVGSSQASPGDQVDVTASGLQPGENVQVNLHSTPRLLTTAQADSNGNVHVTVNIPEEAEHGQHHIEILGEQSGSHKTPISLIPAAPASSSGDTPWAVIATVTALGIAVVGASGLVITRRRHAHHGGASTI
jgi:hypothetical protein